MVMTMAMVATYLLGWLADISIGGTSSKIASFCAGLQPLILLGIPSDFLAKNKINFNNY